MIKLSGGISSPLWSFVFSGIERWGERRKQWATGDVWPWQYAWNPRVTLWSSLRCVWSAHSFPGRRVRIQHGLQPSARHSHHLWHGRPPARCVQCMIPFIYLWGLVPSCHTLLQHTEHCSVWAKAISLQWAGILYMTRVSCHWLPFTPPLPTYEQSGLEMGRLLYDQCLMLISHV